MFKQEGPDAPSSKCSVVGAALTVGVRQPKLARRCDRRH